MRCAVDLHMHSCLSPCGDEAMTPNNIAGMAMLKELDMIAVADHNTASHLPAIAACCQAAGVALLPAMELTTREEVHLLAYFPTVERALDMSEAIYPHLPPLKNRAEIFGEQQQLDEDDEPVRTEEKLLISALDLSLDDLAEMIVQRGGLAVPAHINRGSTGLINALGFVPPGLPFAALEVARGLPLPHRGMPDLPHLYSSDAHRLEDILERDVFLDLDERSADAFFRKFS